MPSPEPIPIAPCTAISRPLGGFIAPCPCHVDALNRGHFRARWTVFPFSKIEARTEVVDIGQVRVTEAAVEFHTASLTAFSGAFIFFSVSIGIGQVNSRDILPLQETG